MATYRMILDLDDKTNSLNQTQLQEIADEVKHKVTLVVSPEQKRNGLNMEVIDQKYTERAYHHHVGNDCYGCYVQKDDERGT